MWCPVVAFMNIFIKINLPQIGNSNWLVHCSTAFSISPPFSLLHFKCPGEEEKNPQALSPPRDNSHHLRGQLALR